MADEQLRLDLPDVYEHGHAVERVRVAAALAGLRPRRVTNGYSAQCPLHPDQRRLVIYRGVAGAVRVECPRGCEERRVLHALGLGALFSRSADASAQHAHEVRGRG